MIVPAQCWPLLRNQRTHYRDPSEYGMELRDTFDTFAAFLPERAERILDIGCGMAGIDVYLHHLYPDAEIVLADKQGVANKRKSGHHRDASQFAHYHDFAAALALLEANGVNMDRVRTCDLGVEPFPSDEFNVVVSLLSWGYHYPISTYQPRVRGVIVADTFVGTDGEDLLAEYGQTQCVFEQVRLPRGKKAQSWLEAREPYRRVVCQVAA